MDFLRNPMLLLFNKAVDGTVKYKREALYVLTGLVVVVGFVMGYTIYKNQANAAAYKDFINALKYYDGVVVATKDKYSDPNAKYFASERDKWIQAENVFSQGYNKHKWSKMGCMFLAFRAEALLNLGKKDEALSLFTESIVQIPSEEVRDYYKIKVALMKVDKGDDSGISELKKIAENEKSAANSLALYQLGAYYWSQKKFMEAKDYWQRLLVKTGGVQLGQASPFAQEVKEKLSLLSIENL